MFDKAEIAIAELVRSFMEPIYGGTGKRVRTWTFCEAARSMIACSLRQLSPNERYTTSEY